jgi:hypothetical protein
MVTIEKELAFLAKKFPDFSKRASEERRAIESGRICGSVYVRGSCGCFYGILTGLQSEDIAQELAWEVRTALCDHSLILTPIEELIADVRPGEVTKDRKPLDILYQALEPYTK